MLKCSDEVLESICFSDESRVVLGHDNQWVWYRKGEDNPSANVETMKFPPGVMVFAVIGVGYKSGLLIVNGSIDSEKYIQNCDELHFIEELDSMKGPLEWIFQQDGATCHTTQVVLDWLEESCDVLHGWPANSPDLSPIELLWAILKKSIAIIKPVTLDDLRTALQNAWTSIPQRVIDDLCKSFKPRLIMCLERQGQSISNDLWMLSDKSCLHELSLIYTREYRIWTPEEDQRLVELHSIHGANWHQIAALMPNRTSNTVKNRWHSHLKKEEHARIQDTELQLFMRQTARQKYCRMHYISNQSAAQ
jgi:hypothetical protein